VKTTQKFIFFIQSHEWIEHKNGKTNKKTETETETRWEVENKKYSNVRMRHCWQRKTNKQKKK